MAQDDILSTKGCKRDPYSETEYNSHHTYYSEWLVGWVRNASTDAIQYRNSQGTVQKTILKGQPANPYTESEYSYKLYQEENWPGGWVINSNMAIRHIDAFNQSGELIALGKQQNPYYYVEFNNKYVLNNWHGGWVEYESEGKAYINAQGEEDEDPEASGSGCGSGSGSGSLVGCGLIAGSAEFRPDSYGVNVTIRISWGDGTFAGGSLPSLSTEIINYNISPFHEDLGHVGASWDGNYRVKLDVGGFPSTFFNIPPQYRY